MSHYARLKVSPDAPVEVIRAAYRVLAAKHHPDRHLAIEGASGDESHDEMVALNTAYQVLINPDSRREYDALLAERRALRKAKTSSKLAAQKSEAELAISTKVDMQWQPAKAQSEKGMRHLSRRMMFLGGSFTGVIVGALVIGIWQTVAQHQMDQALSVQYATRPTATVPNEVAVAPEPIKPTPAASRNAQSAAADKTSATVMEESLAQGTSAKRMPPLSNLSKLSNEELIQMLPSLDTQPGAAGRRRGERHPLDGQPLNLRQDGQLIEALPGDMLR